MSFMNCLSDLNIKDLATYEKVVPLVDDEHIYFDQDIEALVIDVEYIIEFGAAQKFQHLKEIDDNLFNYDNVIISKE